ncbi:hypothetical protein AURDEDRAFT_165824 [Auricularia subglabra TFB-10046 SS5]|nr:hypothetical protein AURDEDRAFT_165824 [Auricularia subglabra TFB-10046 SS5]
MRILGACALDDGSILREGADVHHCGPSMPRAPLRAHHIALLLAATVELEDWRTSGLRRVGRSCWGGFRSRRPPAPYWNVLLTVNVVGIAPFDHRALPQATREPRARARTAVSHGVDFVPPYVVLL